MKTLPDRVLDAPPPQLEALPAFSLPQPLPQRPSTLPRSGNDTAVSAASPAPALPGDAAHSSEVHPHVSSGSGGEGSTSKKEPSTSPQHMAVYATLLHASAGGEEAAAEAKRMRLNGSTASELPLVDFAAVEQSSVQNEVQQPQSHGESLQQAEDGRDSTGQHMEQHSEQTEHQPAYRQESRQLISA